MTRRVEMVFTVWVVAAALLYPGNGLAAEADSGPPVVDPQCNTFADVTKREADSAFTLSYESPRKYFGDKMDPMSIRENSPDQPWWILTTKGKIVWQGHQQPTKSGVLADNVASLTTQTGYTLSAIRGNDMHFALAHEPDVSRSLGVGSESKFDSAGWIPICGNQYRKGGFRISPKGVQFLSGTEGKTGKSDPVFHFDGKSWKRAHP